MKFIIQLVIAHKFKVFAFLLLSVATSLLGVGTLAFINEYLLKSGDEKSIYIAYFAALLLTFFACSLFVEISLARFGQNFIFKMQKGSSNKSLTRPF